MVKDFDEEIDYFRPFKNSFDHPIILALNKSNLELALFILKKIRKSALKEGGNKNINLQMADLERNSILHKLFMNFSD